MSWIRGGSLIREVSHAHISKTRKHLGRSLVLLHVLAEWTVPMLHVRKLVLVLNEEATAVFATADGHVRNHVFEVAFGHVRTEVTHVLHKDFFKADVLKHILSHYDRLVILRRELTSPLEQCLRKEVIFDTLVLVGHRENLLLLTALLLPAATTGISASRRWIHLEQLLYAHRRYARVRHELHQRQGVETDKVPN